MPETRHSNAKPEEERREHGGIYHRVSIMGYSYGFIDCPFCKASVKCFVWSLSGSGKRCGCGALITRLAAYKKAS